MKVRDLQLEPVVSIEPDDSLADAADRMRFYEIGSLAVFEDGELVAIITERDLTRAVADRVDPDRTPVRSFQTSEPTTVSAETDVGEAAATMLSLGVRHLPAMDGNRLAGMVSVRDLLGAELAMTTGLSGEGDPAARGDPVKR